MQHTWLQVILGRLECKSRERACEFASLSTQILNKTNALRNPRFSLYFRLPVGTPPTSPTHLAQVEQVRANRTPLSHYRSASQSVTANLPHLTNHSAFPSPTILLSIQAALQLLLYHARTSNFSPNCLSVWVCTSDKRREFTECNNAYKKCDDNLCVEWLGTFIYRKWG